MIKYKQQRASILIIVLWIISISITLVSVLASNSRLSATIVMHQQDALEDWANMLTIINLAKVEILVAPLLDKKKYNHAANIFNPAKNTASVSDFGGAHKAATQKNSLFIGEKVKLSYPTNDKMIVRIYNLSGKINISNIGREQFKKILVKKIAKENKQVDELLDAWQDWTDQDNLKHLNGAEKEYYSKYDPPYSPRNSALQSVNELNLIKGFREIFGEYDYSQVFTLYGTSRAEINPNIANKQTLLLIPGIDEAIATEIITKRAQQEFTNMTEFNTLIPTEVSSKVKGWFSLSASQFYEIIVYPKKTEQEAIKDQAAKIELYVYKEIVQSLGQNNKPKTLRVFPSYKIKL